MANRRFIDFPIAPTVGDNDVILIWQGGANKQTTKATILQGVARNLNDLVDVNIVGLNNGQILEYDATSGKWVNKDKSDFDLKDLNDVNIISPTNGQVLFFNGSTQKWENTSAGFVPYTGAVTNVNLGLNAISAGSFITNGGTSSQFVKGNGSLDSNTYLTGNQTITLSGDVTGSGATSISTTLANSGVVAGTYNNVATQVRPFTVDSKGRITNIGTAVTITPAWSSITGTPTTLSGYEITDAVPSNRTLTINGTSFDLSANRTWTIPTHDAVTLGTANGLSLSGQVLSLGLASSTTTGALSSTDWNTFNNKQNAGSYVTTNTAQTISANKTFTSFTLRLESADSSSITSLTNIGSSWAYSPSFNSLGFNTNNNFYISTSNGNGGVFSFSNPATVNTYSFPNASGTIILGTGTNNFLPKFTGSTTLGNSQIFDNGTNVGIGETNLSTSFRLLVKGGLPALFYNDSTANTPTYGGVSFYRPINTVGNGLGLTFTANDSINQITEYGYIGSIIELNTSSLNNGSLVFVPTRDGSRAEGMRLLSDKTLLIATQSELTGGGRLQVNGQVNIATVNNSTGDFLTHVSGIINKRTPAQVLTDIGAQASLGFTPVPNTRTLTINGVSFDLSADRSWTVQGGIGGSGTTDFIPKFTPNGTTLGNSQIFDNGTNVGINTSSFVGFKFEVVGAIPALFYNDSTANTPTYGGTVFYRPTSTTNNGVGFAFNLNNSNNTRSEYAYIGALIETNTESLQNGAIIFAPSSGGNRTERLRITSGGNVLIGTQSELTGGGRLQVNGDIRATGNIIANSSSDIRFKDNLSKIDNALESITNLNGYKFDWNDKQQSFTGSDYGVIAQEVEALYPEIVSTNDEGYKSVNYPRLIPIMIEAIKELKEEINQLRK